MDGGKKEMNIRMTISITPEVYRALLVASRQREMSISRTVDTLLRESKNFDKYLARFDKLGRRERDVTPAAASVGINGAFHKSQVSKSVEENRATKVENL